MWPYCMLLSPASYCYDDMSPIADLSELSATLCLCALYCIDASSDCLLQWEWPHLRGILFLKVIICHLCTLHTFKTFFYYNFCAHVSSYIASQYKLTCNYIIFIHIAQVQVYLDIFADLTYDPNLILKFSFPTNYLITDFSIVSLICLLGHATPTHGNEGLTLSLRIVTHSILFSYLVFALSFIMLCYSLVLNFGLIDLIKRYSASWSGSNYLTLLVLNVPCSILTDYELLFTYLLRLMVTGFEVVVLINSVSCSTLMGGTGRFTVVSRCGPYSLLTDFALYKRFFIPHLRIMVIIFEVVTLLGKPTSVRCCGSVTSLP